MNELAYTIIDGPTPGLEVELTGQSLLVRVPPSTPRGSTTGVTLGVRDDASVGTPGRIQVSVVASTRPLARPAPDNVIAPRGETTTIRVLDNDAATNPFPGQPLRVVAVRGIDQASLPVGVSIVPSADGQTLLATISDAAAPIDSNLEYQVADATGDPDRLVWGSVRVSVQDVPDPVTSLRVQSFANRSLTVAWSPGASNNSPIERFEATVTRVTDGSSTITSCSASPCAVPTPGNGPDNRVRVSVIAINAQGPSVPTTLAEAAWSDLIPPAPAILGVSPLDGGLRIGWTKPSQDSAASPIRSYRVTVGGVTRSVSAAPEDPVGTSYWLSVVDVGALANGSSYSVTVSARNDSFEALTVWNVATTTGVPAGAPIAVSAPTAVGSTAESGSSANSVSVSWPGAFAGNGRAIEAYYLWIETGGTPPSCSVDGVELGAPTHSPPPGVTEFPAATTSTVVEGLAVDTTYRVVVYAYNGQGCTASVEVVATPRPRPTAVTGISTTDPDPTDTGRWDFQLTGVTTAGGDTVDLVQYQLVDIDTLAPIGGVGVPTALPVVMTADGQHYGRELAVEVRGCRQYEELLCGAWSPIIALGVAVRIDPPVTITETGGDPDPRIIEITWSPMDAAAYTAVTYQCTGGVVAGDAATSPCLITATPSDDPRLVVSVTVGALTYTREYRP